MLYIYTIYSCICMHRDTTTIRKRLKAKLKEIRCAVSNPRRRSSHRASSPQSSQDIWSPWCRHPGSWVAHNHCPTRLCRSARSVCRRAAGVRVAHPSRPDSCHAHRLPDSRSTSYSLWSSSACSSSGRRTPRCPALAPPPPAAGTTVCHPPWACPSRWQWRVCPQTDHCAAPHGADRWAEWSWWSARDRWGAATQCHCQSWRNWTSGWRRAAQSASRGAPCRCSDRARRRSPWSWTTWIPWRSAPPSARSDRWSVSRHSRNDWSSSGGPSKGTRWRRLWCLPQFSTHRCALHICKGEREREWVRKRKRESGWSEHGK